MNGKQIEKFSILMGKVNAMAKRDRDADFDEEKTYWKIVLNCRHSYEKV